MTFGSVVVLILLFQIARFGADGTVDCGLRNVAVIIDTTMHMPCTRNASDTSTEMWKHFPAGRTETDGVLIYNNLGNMNDEYLNFRVNNSSEGQLDLSTDNIRSTDAGVYQCSTKCDKLGLVVVLDDEPKCNLTEEQPTQLTCSVHYYGSWPPSIKWNSNIVDGIHVAYDASNTTSTKNMVTSILNISSDPSMNASNFSCEIYFDVKSFNFRDNHATNVPEIHQVWSCPIVIIAGNTSSMTGNRSSKPPPNSWTKIAIYIFIAFVSLAVLIVLIFMRTKLRKYIAQQKIVQHGCSKCTLSCRNDVESRTSSNLESKSRRSKSVQSDAGSLRSSVRVEPVYSQVNKCSADATSAARRKSFSASSTDSRGEGRSKGVDNKKALFVIDYSQEISTTVGIDGTVYQELNPYRPVPTRNLIGQVTKPVKPRVNNDVYAAIDHTLVVVPPRHKF